MSQHIWMTRRYQPGTVDEAFRTYYLARRAGLDLAGACRFVGYALESYRQSGADRVGPVPALLVTLARSGHRYARGKHGANYELAGRRLLACYLHDACWHPARATDPMLLTLVVALAEDGHWQPLHDYLEERAGDPYYDGVSDALAGKRGLPSRDLVLARALVSPLPPWPCAPQSRPPAPAPLPARR